MRWRRLGLIFDPRGRAPWMHSHALQPTPLVLDEQRIRLYCGFRDREGVSRVGWFEVSADDPRRVLDWSSTPALDIGRPGAFDDNGVVPSAVVDTEDGLRLYYAGYQLGHRVRFLVLGGLAMGERDGASFHRHAEVPVMERTNAELLFRVPHTVLREGARWRVWYGGGSRFRASESKTRPEYDIRHVESDDGIRFPETGRVVLPLASDEYRVGRPFVMRGRDRYLMLFGASTARDPYRLEWAESADGLAWQRRGVLAGLAPSAGDFDAESAAYPAVVETRGGVFLFYNGDRYGEAGVGCAVLAEGRL